MRVPVGYSILQKCILVEPDHVLIFAWTDPPKVVDRVTILCLELTRGALESHFIVAIFFVRALLLVL